jgi:hypothetical protein
MEQQRFLDLELLFLELGNQGFIWSRSAGFLRDQPVKPGVFGFKCGNVGSLHARVSLRTQRKGVNHEIAPVSRLNFIHCGEWQRGATKGGRSPMADVQTQELEARLTMLRTEHRDLDRAIDALADQSVPDQLQLARLKRRKLRLKDEIAILEGQLIPDIIA